MRQARGGEATMLIGYTGKRPADVEKTGRFGRGAGWQTLAVNELGMA